MIHLRPFNAHLFNTPLKKTPLPWIQYKVGKQAVSNHAATVSKKKKPSHKAEYWKHILDSEEHQATLKSKEWIDKFHSIIIIINYLKKTLRPYVPCF